MTILNFIQTHQYNYPVSTTGTGTALTVAKKSGDPYLVFLTQTGYDDEFVYLSLGCDVEIARHATPTDRETVGGMGYSRFNNRIYCCQGTSNAGELFAIDPTTEAEVWSTTITDMASNYSAGHGLATNGLFLALSYGNTLELRTMGGFKLGEKEYTGRSIKGISKSPASWSFVDPVADEIVVIGPMGNEIATCPAPGSSGGAAAIAFNEFHAGDNEPQQWVCPAGTVDLTPGSIHNPDTPWDPAPWIDRHRIYVANEIDQVIYAGYLAP